MMSAYEKYGFNIRNDGVACSSHASGTNQINDLGRRRDLLPRPYSPCTLFPRRSRHVLYLIVPREQIV